VHGGREKWREEWLMIKVTYGRAKSIHCMGTADVREEQSF